MEITNTDLTAGFLALVSGVFSWVAKYFSGKIKDIDDKQQKIELSLASDFVKKADLSDLQKSVDEIKQAISVGNVEFREIKNSQVKIENRLEKLCACIAKPN